MNLSKQASQARGPNLGSRSDSRLAQAGGGLKGLPPAFQHAALIGRKVLAGLDRGRTLAIQQAKARAAGKRLMVVIAANADRAAGKPERGLAGRISRKLHGAISERHVKRILATLFCLSDSSG